MFPLPKRATLMTRCWWSTIPTDGWKVRSSKERQLLRDSNTSEIGGGFNRSAQHLLILRGEEVCDGDVADLVHGSAESRAVGAMEEWAKRCGDLAGAGKEEQDGR